MLLHQDLTDKTAKGIVEEQEFQLINYLKAKEIEVGLLLNFGYCLNLKKKMCPTKTLRPQSFYNQLNFLSGLCGLVGNNIKTDTLPNFGKKPEFKRKIFANDHKQIR